MGITPTTAMAIRAVVVGRDAAWVTEPEFWARNEILWLIWFSTNWMVYYWLPPRAVR